VSVTVMVITRDYDPTADFVVARLARRNARIFRFDLADFPERLALSGRYSASDSRWRGRLSTGHRLLDLDEITSIWYRKPTRFQLPEAMTSTESRWATAEAKHGLGGILGRVVWLGCG